MTIDPLILPSFDMSLPLPSPALSAAVRLAKIPDLEIIIGTTPVLLREAQEISGKWQKAVTRPVRFRNLSS